MTLEQLVQDLSTEWAREAPCKERGCSDGGGFAIDGPARKGSPHPRGAGSFPRVLGRYVRERKIMTLAQAIRKMTSLPASRLLLGDRGNLAPGMAADVVVFDPATVADRSTFDSPFQYPVGIKVVVVNGVVTLRDGQRSDSGSGRALRVQTGQRWYIRGSPTRF